MRGGRGLPQRFVRSLLVVFSAKLVKPLLLRAPIPRRRGGGGLLSVRCIRSCRPFCCGLPGSILSGRIPNLIHHTASPVSPLSPLLPNGAPLSVRLRSGNPYSRNAASITGLLCSPSAAFTDWHRSRYRL